jgi:hypothetical protein
MKGTKTVDPRSAGNAIRMRMTFVVKERSK